MGIKPGPFHYSKQLSILFPETMLLKLSELTPKTRKLSSSTLRIDLHILPQIHGPACQPKVIPI